MFMNRWLFPSKKIALKIIDHQCHLAIEMRIVINSNSLQVQNRMTLILRFNVKTNFQTSKLFKRTLNKKFKHYLQQYLKLKKLKTVRKGNKNSLVNLKVHLPRRLWKEKNQEANQTHQEICMQVFKIAELKEMIAVI